MDKTACYIIFSSTLNKFYTGITQEGIEIRIDKHNRSFYGNHFTSSANDWQLFLLIPCSTTAQAMKIEAHIKKMKSTSYIQNLLSYPEIICVPAGFSLHTLQIHKPSYVKPRCQILLPQEQSLYKSI